MMSPTKSPNMMSTTGRRPVIAAPTPIPVKPASEMGVSSTRSGPNSSTSPERTLKTVPACATSSPRRSTRGSRRNSSASASRTASPKVISRTAAAASGIHVLPHFVESRERSRQCKLDGFLYLSFHFGVNLIKAQMLRDEPVAENLDGIALGLPLLLFLLGAIVIAADVAHVMSHVAIGIGEKKRRTLALAGALDQPPGRHVDRTHVLPIYALGVDSERGRSRQDRARGGLGIVRVLVVHVVFAHVDHRQLPQGGHVHHFVEHP